MASALSIGRSWAHVCPPADDVVERAKVNSHVGDGGPNSWITQSFHFVAPFAEVH
jgi:hypothetical protein